ncbi:hypothetical protein [Lacibacter sp.]|uniref:hypothetical protein n=1 Tax=Lacibacter sp. TaxID=1915409 RepID=UPI002B4B4DB3|nr:hypothetical protein [Lacibacter sp.]HLP36584.1 hypothetical protein [Lacibacter sp.]
MDERTLEILNRFAKSWVETESRYSDLVENHEGFERLKPVLHFILTLKGKGEDKYFRLGTSMHTLTISRSVNHGLRPDQKHLKVEAVDTNDFEVIFQEGEKIYRKYRIKSLDDIKLANSLQTLKHTLVD